MTDIVFCSQLSLFNWLQNHLIPCPFKTLTGIDCPGCGFQRSVLALLNGNWGKSFYLYPATLPLIIAALLTFADAKFDFDKRGFIKKTVYIFTAVVIMVAYINKMTLLYYKH